jgi:hypothetical protein
MILGDKVQFVGCGKKGRTDLNALRLFKIPSILYNSAGILQEMKRVGFSANKVGLVCFMASSKHGGFQMWVPFSLLQPYQKIANHPITRIFL